MLRYFWAAYADIMTLLAICVMTLFIATLAMVNERKKDETGVEMKAEYILVVEWSDGLDCDVDTWVRTPDDKLIWWKSRTGRYSFLDRDDTGVSSEYFWADGVKKFIPGNREVWTLRDKVPGEYVVNLHLYNCRSGDGVSIGPDRRQEVPVKARFDQINPNVVTVWEGSLVLDKIWQEKQLFRFVIPPDRSRAQVIDGPFVSMIKTARGGG